jgi:hypothetical protein
LNKPHICHDPVGLIYKAAGPGNLDRVRLLLVEFQGLPWGRQFNWQGFVIVCEPVEEVWHLGRSPAFPMTRLYGLVPTAVSLRPRSANHHAVGRQDSIRRNRSCDYGCSLGGVTTILRRFRDWRARIKRRLADRLDLLLEHLALRHQLMVCERGRRIRGTDRLGWCLSGQPQSALCNGSALDLANVARYALCHRSRLGRIDTTGS